MKKRVIKIIISFVLLMLAIFALSKNEWLRFSCYVASYLVVRICNFKKSDKKHYKRKDI